MSKRVVILGLGNFLLSDEGFGVHMVRRLEKRLPPSVELIDGGTGGLILLNVLERADRLLVIDAVNNASPPGTLIKLSGQEILASGGIKLSRHQIGFQEVLVLAGVMGQLPEEIVVIGIKPHSLEWGCELSDPIYNKLEAAEAMVLAQLQTWDIPSHSEPLYSL